ncbi:MAG: 3-hydroxyacyl-CoA dehydrogenase family protein [Armatimonadetes bacterium]|nr:3-hydroxyacyl-CoA dehydrogenase family protein [Armatimonadota bacterium]
MQVDTMTIIGAGTMGTGIAQVAAQAGIEVHLIDTSEDALERSRGILRRSLNGAIEREKLTEDQAAEVEGRITWGMDREAVAGADWIIEAVFEDIEVKRGTLARIGELAREDAVISSNTSTLPIAALAEMSGRPERFIGMHFFNPAPAMKLVEVIPGAVTSREVTDAALALCERMGKQPRVAPDIPGFLVNRAFGALLSAAIDIWLQGAEPADIDAAMELGLGHKMGPLATADLVGLDVCLALLRSLHEQTGHARFEVAPELVAMVEAGKLGRKSGEGFYDYDE